MKILIHAKNLNQNLNIETQAELLSAELEKSGHTVEWSKQTHPARLILNKYDVVHILTERMPLSFKNFLLVITAKTLGIPVVVSSYAVEILGYQKAHLANFQLGYLDAMSVPEAGEIKNLRPFNSTKFIWSALLPKVKHLNLEKKSKPINVIFHIEKKFSDLPEFKWGLDEPIYVDATKLALDKSHSKIRIAWSLFFKKNPAYKNAILILNESNLKNIMAEQSSLFLVNYLKINSILLAAIIHKCLENKSVLVLSENQASGFPDLWSYQKNGLVQNFEKYFSHQLSFSELIEKSKAVRFQKNKDEFIESKMNELNRIYVKVKTQKELKISYANMSYRS